MVGKKEIIKGQTLVQYMGKVQGNGGRCRCMEEEGIIREGGKVCEFRVFPQGGKERREGFPVARAMCHMGSFPL